MSKSVTVELKGKEYVLEYNRLAVKKVEQLGFSTANVGDKLATNIELLFYGALIKNHGFEIGSVRAANPLLDALMEEYDHEPLLEMLIDMLISVVPSLGSDDKEGKKKLNLVVN